MQQDARIVAPTITPRRHDRGPRAVATGRVPRSSRATYWRRRIVVALMVVVLVIVLAQAGAALGGASLAAPGRSPAVSQLRRVIVRPGDSLWSVAHRLVPGGDPRPVVDALVRARHGTTVTPGEIIEWAG